MCQVIFDELCPATRQRWRRIRKSFFCGLSNPIRNQSYYLIHYCFTSFEATIIHFSFSLNEWQEFGRMDYLLECGINITLISYIKFPSSMPPYNYTVCSIQLVFRLLVISSLFGIFQPISIAKKTIEKRILRTVPLLLCINIMIMTVCCRKLLFVFFFSFLSQYESTNRAFQLK